MTQNQVKGGGEFPSFHSSKSLPQNSMLPSFIQTSKHTKNPKSDRKETLSPALFDKKGVVFQSTTNAKAIMTVAYPPIALLHPLLPLPSHNLFLVAGGMVQ